MMTKGKLPYEWKKSCINDIATVVAGGTPKAANPDNFAEPGTEIAWLTPADLSGYTKKYIKYGARDLSECGYNSSSAKLMPKGTLLFSSRAPIGYVAIAANEISTNQGFKNFIFTDHIEPSFAYYYLRNIRGLAESLGTGTTFKEISGATAKKLPFVIVPLPEQKVITQKLDSVLSQVNSIKAHLDKIPQVLKQFRQSVLSAAVNGKLTEEWRKKQGLLLTDWIVSSVGDIAQVATGKTPKRTESKYWDGGNIPWLTSASTGELFTDAAEQYVTSQAVTECLLKVFTPGTLLLAMYGEGKTRGQVTELRISATCNQACAAIIANPKKVNHNYLKLLLMENYEETRKVAAGGAQPNLNLSKVRDISIFLPSLEEQTEIVRRVEKLFSWADSIEKQVIETQQRVNNLTQSILAKAFRGELTEQWRKDNPDLISGENSAESLLKKIKAERELTKPAKLGRKKS
ncbi:restriction endonuclease subunit S [Xenorhabdus cabanillasii]|uniref:HsdS, type I site-specific deoxyribonuclease n=1 Tax=Xenorhabdus cabanillasii JM26 TaxID=1427517 RepID=W1J750_9GAMM|nr:restriction endonuclease subunit S [Xenorhabdus cabanillasii]PHM76100.1 type I restriction-modification enzyme subunit S [Xenorhabdus cabanillasii JM26]CDL86572.1 HsdS, type I site-specific deoxyribonuclease [Xenorhabdus cabanillasii JM26]